ncbi:hypothetical protein LIX60_04555 [Streptomyces sp. S07_1.15]|uniref:hypothetical protein n=1 Tax=Streptomyces sp. S07_1.15 TaxID=2873925 RepID=UPI001D15910F|nr:hypothetical protein [Streptomyces sp. S07_1.15]MCC3650760.1 hypothetical protein [Streptomyces sp. S07_1.15]
MPVILVLICCALTTAGWFWSRPLILGTWRRNPAWLTWSAVLLLMGAGVTYLIGSLVPITSLDPEEACNKAGQAFDWTYRRTNFEEYTQWFPLHNKCNAGYDLIPAWVNPALVALPALALLCLAHAVLLAVIQRRNKKKGTS